MISGLQVLSALLLCEFTQPQKELAHTGIAPALDQV